MTFFGRDAELELAHRCLDRARQGTAQLLWIEGSSGMGKSAFARRLATEVGDDDAVLTAGADELGSGVSYGLLSQVLPVDTMTPFAAGMRLVEHLASVPTTGAVMLVVDDVQWADPPSLAALLAAARRLDHDPVAFVMTSRTPSRLDGWDRLLLDPTRSTRISLSGLDASAVAGMAGSRGVELDPAHARRLCDHTGGHPLYVGALLAELTVEQLRAASGDLPAPRSLAATITASVAALPVGAQQLAAALAVLGAPTALPTVGRVAGVDDPTEALDSLVAAGLAYWVPGELGTPAELAHPLVRQAIYDGLTPRRRRDLHLGAAQATRWGVSWAHRIAAADRPDDVLADELAAGADYELARHDASLAATYLSWAATVTSERQRSEERLLVAARLLVVDGQTGQADALLPRIEQCDETALRDLVLGILAFAHADAGGAQRWLQHVVDVDAPPWVHADAFGQLGQLATLQGRAADAVAAAEAALATGAVDDVVTNLNVWGSLAFGTSMVRGAPAGLARLEERLAGPVGEVPPADAELLAIRGQLRTAAGYLTDAIADLRASIDLARDGAPFRQLPRAHLWLSRALYLAGEWDESQSQARTARSLLDDHRVWMGQLAEGHLVPILAARGQFELADQYAAGVRAAAATLGTIELDAAARLSTAALARARGDAAALIEALAPVAEPGSLNGGPLGILGWWPMLIAARIDAGHLDVTAEIDELVAAARAASLDTTAVAAALRARLAAAQGDADRAAEHFERAIAATGPDAPVLERALLHHAYGRLLRDRGTRRPALVQLRTAHELLLRLGAEAYRRPVADDLASWSERAGGSTRRSPLELTTREQDVVSLVNKGLTNREVGAQLYISVKAVEYHLANVYGKLGIRSRRELREAFATVT